MTLFGYWFWAWLLRYYLIHFRTLSGIVIYISLFDEFYWTSSTGISYSMEFGELRAHKFKCQYYLLAVFIDVFYDDMDKSYCQWWRCVFHLVPGFNNFRCRDESEISFSIIAVILAFAVSQAWSCASAQWSFRPSIWANATSSYKGTNVSERFGVIHK